MSPLFFLCCKMLWKGGREECILVDKLQGHSFLCKVPFFFGWTRVIVPKTVRYSAWNVNLWYAGYMYILFCHVQVFHETVYIVLQCVYLDWYQNIYCMYLFDLLTNFIKLTLDNIAQKIIP
jgi:hypothetical protein